MRAVLVGLCIVVSVTAATADTGVTKVVRTGDTLPGLAGPVTTLEQIIQIDASGRVYFMAFDGTTGGLYLWQKGSGAALLVALGGTPSSMGFADDGRALLGGSLMSVAGEQVVYDGNQECPDPADGVIGPQGGFAMGGGKIAISACWGVLAGTGPVGTLTQAIDADTAPVSLLRMNAAADIYTVGSYDCTVDPGPTCYAPTVYRSVNGAPTALFKNLMGAMPGITSTMTSADEMSISDDGYVVLRVVWYESFEQYDAIVQISPAGAVTVVAKTGDPAPGGGTFTSLGGYYGIHAIGGGGAVFSAGTSTGVGLIVRSSPTGALTTVVSTASPLPGLATTLQGFSVISVTRDGRVALLNGYDVYLEEAHGRFVHGLGGGTLDLGDGSLLTNYGVYSNLGRVGSDGLTRLISDDGAVAVWVGGDEGAAIVVVEGGVSNVVNSHGDAPLAAGRTSCDTGATVGGKPECTLRAAIQLANQRQSASTTIEFDLPTTQPIRVTSTLPMLTVPVTIDGTSEGRVELEPATAGGGGTGLRSSAKLVLRRMGVRRFGGGGVAIESPDGLEIYASEITDNTGHGAVNTNGSVLLGTKDGPDRVLIARNTGIGAYAAAELDVDRVLYAYRTDVTANGSAGLATDGLMNLADATLTNNGGPGAVVMSGTPGTPPGLNVEWYGAVVTRITGNAGDGLRNDTTGIGVYGNAEIRDNGGWGVRARGRVSTSDMFRIGMDSIVVAENGGGTACTRWTMENRVPEPEAVPCGGGGVLSLWADDQVEVLLTNLTAIDNHGPGVLTRSGVRLQQVELARNDGAGAHLLLAGGGGGIYVDQGSVRRNIISDNAGIGVYAETGAVHIYGDCEIARNGSWGIYAEDTAATGPERPASLPEGQRVIVSGNGHRTTCINYTYDAAEHDVVRSTRACSIAGGIASTDEGDGSNVLADLDVHDNAGPGVMTLARVTLRGVDIAGNGGPGVKVAGDIPSSANAIFVEEASRISGNHGHGLAAETGTISLYAATEISGNTGAGVVAELGHVSLDNRLDGMFGNSTISGNGAAGDCFNWTFVGLAETLLDLPCETGGVVTGGRVTGDYFDVVDNTGDGIRAPEGTVTLSYGTVCGNTGEPIIALSQTLTSVTVCGADGTVGGDDDDDGCLAASRGGTGAVWMLLVLVPVVRRRRR